MTVPHPEPSFHAQTVTKEGCVETGFELNVNSALHNHEEPVGSQQTEQEHENTSTSPFGEVTQDLIIISQRRYSGYIFVR